MSNVSCCHVLGGKYEGRGTRLHSAGLFNPGRNCRLQEHSASYGKEKIGAQWATQREGNLSVLHRVTREEKFLLRAFTEKGRTDLSERCRNSKKFGAAMCAWQMSAVVRLRPGVRSCLSGCGIQSVRIVYVSCLILQSVLHGPLQVQGQFDWTLPEPCFQMPPPTLSPNTT